MKLSGVEVSIKNIIEKAAQIKTATRQGMAAGALDVEASAMEKTPVDTGNLKASFFVDVSNPDLITVGNTAEYAVNVHENMNAHHRVGQAKFLESAANEKGAAILEKIAGRIKEVVSG